MKKYIIIFGLLALVFLAGCSIGKEQLRYNVVSAKQIPDQYPDGTFSVKGFLAVKDQYENQSVNLRGIVVYKSECPPCPKDAMCEPCSPPVISLADPVKNITEEHEITISFFSQESTAEINRRNMGYMENLKLGQEVTINVKVPQAIPPPEPYMGSRKGYVYLEVLSFD